jgi:signal transduction histidine kinase
MLAQTYFHDVTHYVSELLGCGAVLLALDCPEAELVHPLLQRLPVNAAARCFGALELLALLHDEQIRALIDVACQSGQMRFKNGCSLVANEFLARSVAIAPVVCPVGIPGYFVLVNAFAGVFTPGDVHLLNDYLPAILPEFESNVRALCGIWDSSASDGAIDGQVALADGGGNTMRHVVDGMKNDLISMVSHELRAPLTAIKGYAGLLQAYSLEDRQRENERETTITPDRQQRYLDIIMDQTRHLEVVMGDLLDVSRIQAGKLILRYTEVDVASLCQQVILLARQRIDQQGLDRHTLRCEVSSELLLIQADANRLQQILHNLLDNAIKYSPDGGLIELQTSIVYPAHNSHPFRPQNETLPVAQITIRDQGIGISAQQRARLFRPFSRLDHPVTSQVQGAGLGLYITQKLVEAMEGTIELISQENKGTSVTIRLPLRQRVEPQQPLLSGEMYSGSLK